MKWIKCSERLPENDDKVIFIAPYDGQAVSGYFEIIKWSHLKEPVYTFRAIKCGYCWGSEYFNSGKTSWETIPTYNVTNIEYWMPLPKDPRDQE